MIEGLPPREDGERWGWLEYALVAVTMFGVMVMGAAAGALYALIRG